MPHVTRGDLWLIVNRVSGIGEAFSNPQVVREGYTSGNTHGLRHSGRPRSVFASASPMKVSVAASSVSLRPTRAEMLPA